MLGESAVHHGSPKPAKVPAQKHTEKNGLLLLPEVGIFVFVLLSHHPKCQYLLDVSEIWLKYASAMSII